MLSKVAKPWKTKYGVKDEKELNVSTKEIFTSNTESKLSMCRFRALCTFRPKRLVTGLSSNHVSIRYAVFETYSLDLGSECRSAQITSFMRPTWCPPEPCRPQLGPILAAWTIRVLSLEIHRNDIQYILNGLAKHRNASSASAESIGTDHVLMKYVSNDKSMFWTISCGRNSPR